MTWLNSIVAVIIVWVVWTQIKKARKGRLDREKKEWLSDVQKAHDSKEYNRIINLMEGKTIDSAELCWVFGNALLQTGKTESGRSVFRKAFTYGDKNLTRKMFGYSELNAGHFLESIAMLQEIESDWLANEFKYDGGYDIVENLGIAFKNLGKYDLAVEALKKAPLGKRTITDGLNKIFILSAECYELSGDKKNALKFYTKSTAYKYSVEIEDRIKQLEK